jgi:hypothetical protein
MLAAAAGGCATKGFLKSEIGAANSRVNKVQGDLEEILTRLNDHEMRMNGDEQRIAATSQRMEELTATTQEAMQAATPDTIEPRVTASQTPTAPSAVPGRRQAVASPDVLPSEEASPSQQDQSAEAVARKKLALLEGALKEGNLFWQSHRQMRQGQESAVKAEINLTAAPYFLSGPDAPTAQAHIQTSATMTAELQGSKDDFDISPSGEQAQPLVHDRALWQWTVKPLTFGHGKKLRLLIRMQPKLTDKDSASYNLPSHEADIDVAVSPSYLFKSYKGLIFGASGSGGLLSLLKSERIRKALRRWWPGSPPPAVRT